MKQKPGKRIVSKSDYIKVQTRRVVSGAAGIYLGCIGITCAILLIASIYCFCLFFFQLGDLGFFLIPFLAFVLAVSVSLGGAAYLTLSEATRIIKYSMNTNPGVPLTRANIDYLPAPDSLVRASHEPLQAQETVLLRAAMETMDGQEDELLRASAGGQE